MTVPLPRSVSLIHEGAITLTLPRDIDIGRHRILVGDVRARLRDLPDGSVHCCVTSPPYYGLRDYGTATWDGGDPECDHRHETKHQQQGATSQRNGRANVEDQRNENFRHECGRCGAVRVDDQLGLEPTLAEYVAAMVNVFREVRRVLRDDGTLWINIGDSYAQSGSGRRHDNSEHDGGSGFNPSFRAGRYSHGAEIKASTAGLKPKDLMMVPARLAIALQDDGWYLRSDIIWHKKAPMPESVTDRPTSAHEHVFLLAKRPRYYYDADAVREEPTGINGGGWSRAYAEAQPSHGAMRLDRPNTGVGANLRNVWTLGPEPFPGSHFAVMPTEIPRRAIKAGTSERGVCAACGAPWVRQTEVAYKKNRPSAGNDPRSRNEDRLSEAREIFGSSGWQGNNLRRETTTTGWAASCACDADVIPATCLDPFLGSGTTMLVADQLGRACVGIELNETYARMAERRVRSDAPLLVGVA